MSSNYLQNLVDLDTYYVSANDVNYRALSASNISYRKTIVFGQNGNSIGSFAFLNPGTSTEQYNSPIINAPKVDYDPLSVIGATKDCVYYLSNTDNKVYQKGIPNQSGLYFENNPQTPYFSLGGTISRSSPVQAGNLSNWSQIAVGYQSGLAIRNGVLYAWGFVGNIIGPAIVYSPIQIAPGNNWYKVAVSTDEAAAIKTDATLWTWGSNLRGGLGLGDQTARVSSPTQVGTLSDWSEVSCGYYHMLSIKYDGTLWSWGNNSYGQLGLSDQTDRSSPVQIGLLSNWSKIFASRFSSVAIKTDGTLWTWGAGGNGQLGLSNTTSRSSPVQVGALSNWAQITGATVNTKAIKTDGTMWAWGSDGFGSLGLNTTAIVYSPVQVGSLSNWYQVGGGERGNSYWALKTDGTLWACGYNSSGQLGLGNTINTYTFIQVGSLSNWTKVFGNGLYGAAQKSDGTLWTCGNGNYLAIFDRADNPYKQLSGF